MHEGAWSSRLGIPGRPAEAESSIVARDLALARLTGGRYHLLHCSTAQSVALIRAARADGVRVTAECTPQHLVLTDEQCAGFDPVFKMHPPLRESSDVDALRDALRDGTIDAIASDHAPHSRETKEVPFEEAPPGMLGVETALAVMHTVLVASGVLTLSDALAACSWKPARLAALDHDGHGGPVAPGQAANLCVFDPDELWVVDASRLASKSVNSPWDGWKLTGKVRHTIRAGTPTVRDGELA
jgi:dihydroorotase